MTKGAQKLLTIVFIGAFVFGGLFAYGQGWFTPDSTPGGNSWFPGGDDNTNPTVAPQSGVWAGQIYASVVDKVTGTAFTTSAVTVNQIVADQNGQFDFISGAHKTVTQSANPQAEGKIFNAGDQVIIVATCTGNPTNGLDYYPVWYYVNLAEGARVYQLDSKACFQQAIQPHTNTPLTLPPQP